MPLIEIKNEVNLESVREWIDYTKYETVVEILRIIRDRHTSRDVFLADYAVQSIIYRYQINPNEIQ